jgi:predicted restriction endonuclease
MTRAAVLHQFDRLNVWSRGDQRAPHKPLLVLYALGRWHRGDTAAVPFREVERDLTPLLKEFGPPRRSQHAEYPFWRLQRDGVWTVHAAGPLTARQGNTDPRKSEPARLARRSRVSSRDRRVGTSRQEEFPSMLWDSACSPAAAPSPVLGKTTFRAAAICRRGAFA